MSSDRIEINIGGRTFETTRSTIMKYPETVLGRSLVTRVGEEKEHLFFDRNPDLFGFILDFYRNGTHTTPTYMSIEDFNKELDFWGLPLLEIFPQKASEMVNWNYITYTNIYLGNTLILRRIVDNIYSKRICYFSITSEDIVADYANDFFNKDTKISLADFKARIDKIFNGVKITEVTPPSLEEHPENTIGRDGVTITLHKDSPKESWCKLLRLEFPFTFSETL